MKSNRNRNRKDRRNGSDSLPEQRAGNEGRYNRLDELINNAGVFLRKREETEDGWINFCHKLSFPFSVDSPLARHIQGECPSRITNVASKHSGIKINFDDLMTENKYSFLNAVDPYQTIHDYVYPRTGKTT